VVVFGDVQVDLARRAVTRAGVPVHLTQIEYRLLVLLIANPGNGAHPPSSVARSLGPSFVESSHYLRVYVGPPAPETRGGPDATTTHPHGTGVGYRFQP